jgi:hypothetical protein
MTPLAHVIANQLTFRPKDQAPFIRANAGALRDLLHDTHYFETTEILPTAHEFTNSLTKKWNKVGFDGIDPFTGLVFLPAPKTWIEWKAINGVRMAIHLQDTSNEKADVNFFVFDPELDDVAVSWLGSVSLNGGDFFVGNGSHEVRIHVPQWMEDTLKSIGGSMFAQSMLSMSHLMLAFINSPKIIGRQQHMPHRALEKALIKTFGAGKFPLRAWTEIKLHVSKPVEIDDGEPHEAHLTGRRALHFCRKHIRIRRGRLEYVSAHWRGDPAIGIKQSRYKVVA